MEIKWISRKEGIVCAAFEDGVRIAAAAIEGAGAEEKAVRLKYLEVAEEYRGEGYGSDLLSEIEEKLSLKGCRVLLCELTGEQEEFGYFLEENGFSCEDGEQGIYTLQTDRLLAAPICAELRSHPEFVKDVRRKADKYSIQGQKASLSVSCSDSGNCRLIYRTGEDEMPLSVFMKLFFACVMELPAAVRTLQICYEEDERIRDFLERNFGEDPERQFQWIYRRKL